MLMLPEGSRLVYVGEFDLDILNVTGNLTNAEALQQVTSRLSNAWHITVESSDYNTHFLSRTVTLHLLSNDAHGGDSSGTDGTDDIRRIVDGEFYNVAGVTPTGSRITQYQLPRNPVTNTQPPPVDTGAPTPPPDSGSHDSNNGSGSDFNVSTFAYTALFGFLGIIVVIALVEHYA